MLPIAEWTLSTLEGNAVPVSKKSASPVLSENVSSIISQAAIRCGAAIPPNATRAVADAVNIVAAYALDAETDFPILPIPVVSLLAKLSMCVELMVQAIRLEINPSVFEQDALLRFTDNMTECVYPRRLNYVAVRNSLGLGALAPPLVSAGYAELAGKLVGGCAMSYTNLVTLRQLDTQLGSDGGFNFPLVNAGLVNQANGPSSPSSITLDTIYNSFLGSSVNTQFDYLTRAGGVVRWDGSAVQITSLAADYMISAITNIGALLVAGSLQPLEVDISNQALGILTNLATKGYSASRLTSPSELASIISSQIDEALNASSPWNSPDWIVQPFASSRSARRLVQTSADVQAVITQVATAIAQSNILLDGVAAKGREAIRVGDLAGSPTSN
eukprot:gene3797-13866_t